MTEALLLVVCESLLKMNMLIVLILILVIVVAVAYHNSKPNAAKTSCLRVPTLKKESSYILQSQIMNEMALQKAIQEQHRNKRKVSVHIQPTNPQLKEIIGLTEKLAPSIDFYLICPYQTDGNQMPPISPAGTKQFTYKSTVGCVSLIRQLSADIHIQSSASLISLLKPFLPTIATTDLVVSQQSAQVLSRGYQLKSFNNFKEIFHRLGKV